MTQQQVSTLVMLVLFLGFMYMLMWRPQAAQLRRRREMLSRLRAGDRVVTIGGLHATVLDIKDDALTLELAPNVRVKAERGAVQSVRGRQQQAKTS